ncbi:MAG TPA: ParB/RepB/Spo0J family partition protein [Hyphomicrobiaceae bacterium]|jgi:ParB family chromosome partitioning protein
MALGNRGFAQGLTGTLSPSTGGARLPPRTGLLGERENRLAELAAGKSVTRLQELVDPARCRIWEGHNRDYAALNSENCADLTDSFKAEGRQNFPAIVRRIEGDRDHDYEVICGARRHWAVTWMRAHHQPDFKFLVEPRELTDEEAFRLADLENRSRRDLSDYERASDYARAIDRYYAGNQQRMAERLEVSKSWLSRYLELARLPTEVLAAFGSPHAVGISHAATLAPLLRAEDQKGRLTAEAQRLAAEQADRAARRENSLPPAAVMQRLVGAARAAAVPRKAGNPREHVVRAADGAVVARGQRTGRGGAVTISLPTPARHAREALVAAVEEILNQMGSSPNRGERRGHR